ncbi:MAG: GYD domain-containing protein [Thermoplasmata archaeon]
MPMYVTLYKLTDQGRKTIRDSPKRAREIVAKIDKMPGHKVHQVLYTTGRYDMVVVSEAPNDQAANAVALSTMAAGNVVGETLHAYTLDDIDKVVSKLP